MTPDAMKRQADTDQAREAMADRVQGLLEQAPAFLVAVSDLIDLEAGLADLPGDSVVILPLLAFRMIAQLAKIGAGDVDGIITRRKEEPV